MISSADQGLKLVCAICRHLYFVVRRLLLVLHGTFSRLLRDLLIFNAGVACGLAYLSLRPSTLLDMQVNLSCGDETVSSLSVSPSPRSSPLGSSSVSALSSLPPVSLSSPFVSSPPSSVPSASPSVPSASSSPSSPLSSSVASSALFLSSWSSFHHFISNLHDFVSCISHVLVGAASLSTAYRNHAQV